MKQGAGFIFFEEDGHLNIGGRVLYAEAIQMDRRDSLPKKVYQHGNSCSECSVEILLLNALLKEEYADTIHGEHPFFDNTNSNYSVGNDLENINALLEKIKAEAIILPLYENLIEEQLNAAYRRSASTIKVLTPENEQLCQNEVHFTFEEATPTELVLLIKNHKGQVYKAKIPANTTSHLVTFQPPTQFPTGLYYWTMAGKGIKRIAGKFYIYQNA